MKANGLRRGVSGKWLWISCLGLPLLFALAAPAQTMAGRTARIRPPAYRPLPAQVRPGPAAALGRSAPKRTPSQSLGTGFNGGTSQMGMGGGNGGNGTFGAGMVPRVMAAPMGGGAGFGGNGVGGMGMGGQGNTGGIRYVTVQTPKAVSQSIARSFFQAGGIRFYDAPINTVTQP